VLLLMLLPLLLLLVMLLFLTQTVTKIVEASHAGTSDSSNLADCTEQNHGI